MKQPTVIRRAGLVIDQYLPDHPAGKPPLVIMHGLFGSRDNWRSQARAFSVDRLVYVPDMPNHGDSDHTENISYPALAQTMWHVFSEERLALLGHSMGGKVAMAMALDTPERCSALMVADIAPRTYPPRHDEIFAGMHAVQQAKPKTRREGEDILAAHIPERDIRLFLLKSLAPVAKETGESAEYQWKLNLSGLVAQYGEISQWSFTKQVYHGAALLIRGGRSPYVSNDDIATMRKMFPALQVETISAAGHWLHAEARDHFVTVVRQFIS
jgi:esterase